jgi:hypothetical protein
MFNKTLLNILFILIAIFLLLFLFVKTYNVENFATLPSTALLGLVNQSLKSEQEMMANILATAESEVKEGQADFEQATANEARAQAQLDAATAELNLRKINYNKIKDSLTKSLPPPTYA